MLPDIDGIEVCRRIRKTSDVPILMLTARDEDVDKIIGLEVGADDYMTKPFNPRELVARVKSILRRSTPERRQAESAVIRHGDLIIDAGRREVRVGEDEIQLAPKEFDLLWELLDHRGLVLTRDQLLERVWGYTFAGDTRTVDVHVRQLRRKLGDASPIVTVWGVGYKVSPAKNADAGVACAVFALAALPAAGPLPRRHRPRRHRLGRDRVPAPPELFALAVAQGAPARGERPDPADRPAGDRRRRQGPRAPAFDAPQLEAATGDRIYYFGVRRLFPGGKRPAGCRALPRSEIDLERSRPARRTFEFTPPGGREFIAVARPLSSSKGRPLGALVVAKPKTELRDTWLTLMKFFAVSILGGLLVAGDPVLVRVAADHEAGARALRGGRRDRERPLRRRRARSAGRRRDQPPRRPLPARWRRGSPRPRSASATS